MNHNHQQDTYLQDDNQCEHEFKNVPGVGKVCVRCGEGAECQKKEKL